MLISELPLNDHEDLAFVGPDEAVSTVATILSEGNIGALPVCNQSGGLVGILSERDIVHGLCRHGNLLGDMKVSDLMSADVVTCQLGDEVNEIMQVMNQRGFRHLPVLDGIRLHSIVSSRDVMAAMLEETATNFRTMGLAYEMVR